MTSTATTGSGSLGPRTERPSKSALLEIGDTGLRRSGGRVYEEFVPNLKGRRAAKTYQEMRSNCAVIGSIFFSAEEFITENGFTITPHPDGSPSAIEQADHAEGVFDDMEHTKSEMLAEALSASVFGYSLLEKVYKIRAGPDAEIPEWRSKFNDRKVGIRKLPIRAQNTIEEWEWSEHGDVLGFLQKVPMTSKENHLKMEEVLHFRTTSDKSNPEGRSWLRSAYRSWWFLKRIQEYEAIGVSKDMAGVPVGFVPEEIMSSNADTDQKATYAKVRLILERMQRGENAHVLWPGKTNSDGTPTGWDLQPFQSGGRRPMDVDGIIRRYESRILVSVLAEAVLLGMQGNVGSWSLASTKTHGFAVALGGLQRKMADVFNRQLLPELAILNGWPPEWAPTVTFADLETSDMAVDAQSIATLVGVGALTPDDSIESGVRERLGFDPKEEVSSGQLQDAMGAFEEGEAV